MKAGKKALVAVIALLLAIPLLIPSALAEENYYTIYQPDGSVLCRIGGEVYEDDEYISGDNQLYRIQSVDKGKKTAQAEHMGEEPASAQAAFQSQAETLAAAKAKRLIGIYCTHSDESYEPTDGVSSSEKKGGIYDVAGEFAQQLESMGISTIVDETLHHPHDAGAYRRSQSTAAALVKQGPDAIIDVHRDGVPADEYTGKVDGESMTMIRLLVGKRNPNSAANRDFAKQLKAKADEMYPGLIKDIYIGKGNYNQELMPHSILLEFGTYQSDKEDVLKSAPYIAQVMAATLYGDDAVKDGTSSVESSPGAGGKASPSPAAPPAGVTGNPTAEQQGTKGVADSSKGSGSGIAWVIGLFAVGLVIVGLLVGGKTGLGHRLKRTMSEMTGGLVGEKPPREDEE